MMFYPFIGVMGLPMVSATADGGSVFGIFTLRLDRWNVRAASQSIRHGTWRSNHRLNRVVDPDGGPLKSQVSYQTVEIRR
jgi:hypothetical protein